MMRHSNSKASTTPASDPALEAAILRALSRLPSSTPEIPIAPDFAGRVAQRAVAQTASPSLRWLGWGPRLLLGSTALLTAGMFALAPHASPSLSNIAFDGELLLLAELGGLLIFSQTLFTRD
jgi:hypothetical protein